MAKRGKEAAKQPEEPPQSPPKDNVATADAEDPGQKDGSGAPKPRWSGGTWKGKSAAVAEIAKESISAAVTAASETAQAKTTSTTPNNRRFSDRLMTPSKSSPTTKLSMSSQKEESSTEKASEALAADAKTDAATEENNDPAAKELEQSNEKSNAAPGWRGWWAGREEKAESKAGTETSAEVQDSGKATTEQQTPVASAASAQPQKPVSVSSKPASELDPKSDGGINPSTDNKSTADQVQQQSRASWFGLWGSGAADPGNASTTMIGQKSTIAEPEASNVASDGYSTLDDNPAPHVDGPNKNDDATPQPSSSWAFWSREPPKMDKSSQKGKEVKSEVGELAVENTSSESQPKPAQLTEEQQKEATAKSTPKKRDRPTSTQSADENVEGKKQKPLSTKSDHEDQKSTEPIPQSANASGDESSQTGVEPPADDSAASLRKKIQRLHRQNLLLPAVHKTFHAAESPSYWQQLFRIFGRGTPAEQRHLSINPSPPKILKALAIGVHGYFPAPLISKVLGQPTGTSLRFANGAAAAIQKWTEKRGYSCEIEKVALEGEGMIENRVDSLWKLLLNWIDQIRNADFIIIACHSQGVPVAVMLLARLISFGCLNPQARLGLCAMAGVNLGPFPSYHSRILDRSANELFEFSRPQSAVSKKYASALEICLKQHVRIVYIGSIDDQLVSLESALFTTVTHPYIYRAVFVDGRIHAPSFITSLVGMACKLRNLSISDHGLIRELSGPLAGSLYTGEGHSRIYDDQAVYELAVEHALETSTLATDVALDVKDYEIPTSTNSNPYFLPWAMRGVLEEEFVRTELSAETDELLRHFENWKPTSKVLKDVKFRLEAVRSKL